MDKIKIGMVAPAFPYYPVWVAQERGFFAKSGIECEPTIYPATDKVTSALKDGDCQLCMATSEGPSGDAANGGSLRLIAGNANKGPLSLIGGKNIRKIEDLRGKKVGTSSLKEGTAIIVQMMLAAHGLHYPGDYDFDIVGAHPQRWDHLQDGSIDAGLQLVPYNYIAEEAGYPNLGNVVDYVPDYAFTAIAANLNWANDHRDLTVRTLAAMKEAVQWTSGHIDEAAEIVAKATKSNWEHTKRALSDMFKEKVSPLDLRIDRKAFDALLKSMHDFDLVEKDVKLSYEICLDESFLAAV